MNTNGEDKMFGRLKALSLTTLVAGLALLGAAGAQAQDVTLKLHHFLPPPSVAHAKFIKPWAEKVERESGGRIKIEIYPAMQLGGKPPQLFDQVRDGVADVVWTVAGYTAGQFMPVLMGAAEEKTGTVGPAFLVFTVICTLSLIFGVKLLPETKGRTLEEIARSWKK